MQKLTEKYRPKRLTDVVGQQPARMLQAFAEDPYASCWLLTGAPGTGKTTCALALAGELGCDAGGDLDVICASELSVESVREILRTFSFRPMFGKWRVWVIEELETLHPQAQTLLKRGLEELPAWVVVVATSNDTSKLQAALLQRFSTLIFESRDRFAVPGNERLRQIAAELGCDLPQGWAHWGYDNRTEGHFSLRVAIDKLQTHLLREKGKSLGSRATLGAGSA